MGKRSRKLKKEKKRMEEISQKATSDGPASLSWLDPYYEARETQVLNNIEDALCGAEPTSNYTKQD